MILNMVITNVINFNQIYFKCQWYWGLQICWIITYKYEKEIFTFAGKSYT